jgi:hypothetical protein
MTYRSDSDVPVPYGRVVRNTRGKASTSHHNRNFHGEKEHVVAILASNCGGKSGRYHFLDSLIKHLPVKNPLSHTSFNRTFIKIDVWGGWGRRYDMSFSCPGKKIKKIVIFFKSLISGHFTADCPDIGKYRFYLAFENSLCSGYITEKLWWNAYYKVVILIW